MSAVYTEISNHYYWGWLNDFYYYVFKNVRKQVMNNLEIFVFV